MPSMYELSDKEVELIVFALKRLFNKRGWADAGVSFDELSDTVKRLERE